MQCIHSSTVFTSTFHTLKMVFTTFCYLFSPPLVARSVHSTYVCHPWFSSFHISVIRSCFLPRAESQHRPLPIHSGVPQQPSQLCRVHHPPGGENLPQHHFRFQWPRPQGAGSHLYHCTYEAAPSEGQTQVCTVHGQRGSRTVWHVSTY